MVVELGEKYARFHSNGGTLTSTITSVFSTTFDSSSGWTLTQGSVDAVNLGEILLGTSLSGPDASYWATESTGGGVATVALGDITIQSGITSPSSGIVSQSIPIERRHSGVNVFKFTVEAFVNNEHYPTTILVSSTGSRSDLKINRVGDYTFEFTDVASLIFGAWRGSFANAFCSSVINSVSLKPKYGINGTGVSSAVISSGALSFFHNSEPTTPKARRTISTNIGTSYTVKLDVVVNKDSGLIVKVGTSAGGSEITSRSSFAVGINSFTFVATSTTTHIELSAYSQFTYTNVSVTSLDIYSDPASAYYEIVTPYSAIHLNELNYVQSADVLTFCHPLYAPRELRRLGATNWTLTEIDFTAPSVAPTGVTVTVKKPSSSDEQYFQTDYYVVTGFDSTGTRQSMSTSPVSASNNLFLEGSSNRINWTNNANATKYFVYKLQGGLYGYIGSATTGEAIYNSAVPSVKIGDGGVIDDNIAPDMTYTPPIYDNDFTGAGTYPRAVSYSEQRRCFAGAVLEPQKLWMTRVGTESDMSYSIPIRDDDRIEIRVSAREANAILHIVPLAKLILLTNSAEWVVTSVNSEMVTPKTISVRPSSYNGSNCVQPIVVDSSIVFCAARGGHVYTMGYSWQQGGYVTSDLSLRSSHLFDNFEIVSAAFQRGEVPIIWLVSSSGILIGMTFIPEEAISAAHFHVTEGSFESVCCVKEGNRDVLYAVVKRTIAGNEARYVEQMQQREELLLDYSFYVDSGMTYDGFNVNGRTITITSSNWTSPQTPFTLTSNYGIFYGNVGDAIVFHRSGLPDVRCTIVSETSSTVVSVVSDAVIPEALRNTSLTLWSFAVNVVEGLSHLEGKTVSVLADGAYVGQQNVANGQITIDRPAYIITVGLPYTSDLQTLPLALQIEGMAQGREKNINKAWVKIKQSSGVFAGQSDTALREYRQRTTEPYGAPPSLVTGEIEIAMSPMWKNEGQIFIRHTQPLPLTIVGLSAEYSIGG
jgi:hypothetical protein